MSDFRHRPGSRLNSQRMSLISLQTALPGLYFNASWRVIVGAVNVSSTNYFFIYTPPLNPEQPPQLWMWLQALTQLQPTTNTTAPCFLLTFINLLFFSHTGTNKDRGWGQPAVAAGNVWEQLLLNRNLSGAVYTAADSRTGRHERLRKCLTQFSASSLPGVVERWRIQQWRLEEGGRVKTWLNRHKDFSR